MKRVFLILALLVGCPQESTETSAPVTEAAPPGIPARANGHVCIDTAALAEIRAGLPSPIAAALPEDAADFLVHQLGPLPGVESLALEAQVCGLSLGDEMIFAGRTRGGTHGDLDSVSRVGDVVVFGEEQARQEGAEYLARVVTPEVLDAPVSFTVHDGVVAGRRPWVERVLGDWQASGRSAIAAERERHDEAPAFGDPEVALEVLVRHARRLIEYLPDVGQVDGELVARDGNLVLSFRASIRQGSPLARSLTGQSQAPARFDALPLGTALAYMRASEGSARLSTDLLEVAGERASDAERAQIAQAAEAMSPPFTFAMGAQSEPWAEYSGMLPDEQTIARVLAGPYVRGLTGGLFGCERVGAVWPTEGDPPRARCQRPPLSIRSGSLRLGRRDARLAGESPDVSRLIGESEPVLGAVYLDPLRVPAALALFAFAEPPAASVEAAAPVILTWRQHDGVLMIQLRCSPATISQLVAIAATFAD